ncbi:MAG: hypothetical protein NTW59_00950 [Candidatus Diapherotrites archaeon]|nr:hypothetical protein [Candidatus Diapherotrites archaeon]
MLVEFLSHLLSFDLNWIAGLIMNNLHWLFAFAAFVIIAEKGHKPVWHFLAIVGLLYAFSDILNLAGWILVPFIIALPVQLFVGLFFPEGGWVQKRFAIIVTFLLMALSFINTFYFSFLG